MIFYSMLDISHPKAYFIWTSFNKENAGKRGNVLENVATD